MLEQIPQPIATALAKLMAKMNWPDDVPSYAEFKRPRQSSLWKAHKDLTIGDLEQLVEQHVRLAHKSIARFKLRGGSPATAKTAAGHIFRATVYRCTYLATMQVDDPPVSEFPFPLLTNDEAARINGNTEIDPT